MRILPLFCMTIALSAGDALADERSGFFLGLAGGAADLDEELEDLDLASLGIDVEVSDTAPAWSAFAGYQFNRYLGVRGGYVDFETFDDIIEVESIGDVPDIDIDLEGWMVGVDGHLPMGRWISLTGRAGYIAWESQAKLGLVQLEDSKTGSDPFYGGGLELSLGKSFGIEATHTRFAIDGNDVDMSALGVRVRF